MSLIKFPGLIDIHTHLREPGATHKEDFLSSSRAAIQGGITYMLDMPNNPLPTLSLERIEEKIHLAKKAICDIGLYLGTDGHNLDQFTKTWSHPHVFGLKIYCNHTTGTLLVEDHQLLEDIFAAWQSDKPILVHAEGKQLEMAIELATKFNRRLHVCHISQKSEVALVRQAKKNQYPISAGVTPHHLFLTDTAVTKLHGFAIMKPPLGTQADQDALWEGLLDSTIDLVESDHAPHTLEEKNSPNPPFGVPGLETMLGLLLSKVHDHTITLDQVHTWLHTTPHTLFHIPEQPKTYIEFDPTIPYELRNEDLKTKCGWSPFNGWQLYGRVEAVILHNHPKLINGKIITN